MVMEQLASALTIKIKFDKISKKCKIDPSLYFNCTAPIYRIDYATSSLVEDNSTSHAFISYGTNIWSKISNALKSLTGNSEQEYGYYINLSDNKNKVAIAYRKKFNELESAIYKGKTYYDSLIEKNLQSYIDRYLADKKIDTVLQYYGVDGKPREGFDSDVKRLKDTFDMLSERFEVVDMVPLCEGKYLNADIIVSYLAGKVVKGIFYIYTSAEYEKNIPAVIRAYASEILKYSGKIWQQALWSKMMSRWMEILVEP
jgi:hypothetical protein